MNYMITNELIEGLKNIFNDRLISIILYGSVARGTAMRSITVLSGCDSSKHSGIIAYFNQNLVKTGDFDKEASKIVKKASFLREKSDYEDGY